MVRTETVRKRQLEFEHGGGYQLITVAHKVSYGEKGEAPYVEITRAYLVDDEPRYATTVRLPVDELAAAFVAEALADVLELEDWSIPYEATEGVPPP